jgi:PAS domain S-box-containing protein
MKDTFSIPKPIIYKKSPMGDEIRNYEWTGTSLGPIESWPVSLRTTVNQMLDSAFPMMLWWGDDNIQLYNDACAIVQRYHPAFLSSEALGRSGEIIWPELWPLIKAKKEIIFTTGEAVLLEDKLISTPRGNGQEDVYWTYSFDPVRNDEGSFRGLLAIFKEATQLHRKLQQKEQEQAFLLRLSDKLRSLQSPEQLEAEAVRLLGEFVGADRVGFAEIDDRTSLINIGPNFVKKGIVEIKGSFTYEDHGYGMYDDLRAGHNVVKSNISNDELLTIEQKAIYQQMCVGALVNYPLIKAGKLCSVLFVHFCSEHTWTTDEISLLEQSAVRIWDMIQVARSERDLVLSEQRYRTIFESIDDAFMVIEFTFDETGKPFNYRFLVTNPAFERQTGLKNVQGKTIKEIMPDVESAWIERYGQVVTTGQSIRFDEYNAGTGSWYDVYAVAANHPGDQVIVVFHDITERKQEAQRKNDFLSMASHELKTPLTSVNGYLHILKGKASQMANYGAIDLLDRTTRQISKMTAIINSFLNIARIDAGKVAIERRLFDVVEVVRAAGEEAVNSFTTHRFRFEPVEPALVNADYDKINLVIENFISNAVKYSQAGTEIQMVCVHDGTKVKVSVLDQGMGLTAADQDKIFKRFYRVENENTKFIAGFGIGLYICKEIIERHKGVIGVESKIGEGSTFWFELPVNV